MKKTICLLSIICLVACSTSSSSPESYYKLDIPFAAQAKGAIYEIKVTTYTTTKNKNDIGRKSIETGYTFTKKGTLKLTSTRHIYPDVNWNYLSNTFGDDNLPISQEGKIQSEPGVTLNIKLNLVSRDGNEEVWTQIIEHPEIGGRREDVYVEFTKNSFTKKFVKNDSIVYLKSTYKYDDLGNNIVREITQDKFFKSTTMEFDDKNLMLKCIVKKYEFDNADDVKATGTTTYNYEYFKFDDKDNWIECIGFIEESGEYEYTKREIEYFE